MSCVTTHPAGPRTIAVRQSGMIIVHSALRKRPIHKQPLTPNQLLMSERQVTPWPTTHHEITCVAASLPQMSRLFQRLRAMLKYTAIATQRASKRPMLQEPTPTPFNRRFYMGYCVRKQLTLTACTSSCPEVIDQVVQPFATHVYMMLRCIS